jgi:hypothetical protein
MLLSRVLSVAAITAFTATALANGLDRLSRDMPGLERLVPRPFRAQADRAASATALDRKDNGAALASSRNAVATDPADPDATADLGSALMQVGRIQDAERTFRVAAQFGWRNVQTQAFWYEAALQAGDDQVAAERLDALLRVHPQLVDQAELLKPMEGDPAAIKALAIRLQQHPPWLPAYLKVDDDTPSDVMDRRLAVMAELNSSRFSIGCDATVTFAHALLDNGRRHDAETLWNANCPSMKVAALIADPTFAQVFDTSAKNPFSWQLVSSGNLSANPASAAGGSGGLVLANSAPGTRLALVQTVALPVGLYRFYASPAEAPANPGSPGKLFVSWGCNGRPPFPDTASSDLFGGGQDIRVSKCDRQQIGLWIRGGATIQLQSINVKNVG